MMERRAYLNQLVSWKDKDIIKLVSGVRHCGKTTILKMYQEYLLNSGVDQSQIISINFDDLEYEELLDYHKLYQYIKDRLAENKMIYVFLDEIQNVPSYGKVVDSLYVKENIDIYIVRSTKHPITHLNSQYIEIHALPLSFKEIYKPGTDKEEAFQKYMKTGGFPYINQIQLDKEQIDLYLEGINNTVIVKDMEALCESYLYYPVEVMDISGKEVLKSNKKYYIVDSGIRNYILPKQSYDLGFTIENIVYLELLRRRYIVNIGRSGLAEVDFIAKRNDVYTYIQVTASLVDENTFNREIPPLKLIEDNYEKIILTLDRYTLGNYDGIKVINIIDWLLEE